MRKIKKEDKNRKTHKIKALHICVCHLYVSTVLDATIPCLILNR
jgi:hypothetical protein